MREEARVAAPGARVGDQHGDLDVVVELAAALARVEDDGAFEGEARVEGRGEGLHGERGAVGVAGDDGVGEVEAVVQGGEGRGAFVVARVELGDGGAVAEVELSEDADGFFDFSGAEGFLVGFEVVGGVLGVVGCSVVLGT